MKRNLTGRYIYLILLALITLTPFYWIIQVSLKTNDEIFSGIMGLPDKLHFENYANIWTGLDLGRFFMNTIFISLCALVINLVVTSWVSYLISRHNFRKQMPYFLYFLAGMSIPGYVLIYPLFIGTQRLGIYDTWWALIIIYAGCTMPLSILIMVGFMRNIPKELDESASIDGAGIFAIFTRIIIPSARPAIFTVATIQFILSYWNSYLLPAILIKTPDRNVVNVRLAATIAKFDVDYVGMAAGVVLTLIPAFIFFMVLQRYIVSGMGMGSVKE